MNKITEEPAPKAKDIPIEELREMEPIVGSWLTFKADHFKGQSIRRVPTGYLNWFVRNTPENLRGSLFHASVAELIYRQSVNELLKDLE